VAASLRFIPAELLPFASYRGLWVQRVVQIAGRGGGSLAAVPVGSTVSMVIQVGGRLRGTGTGGRGGDEGSSLHMHLPSRA
jgi:hypothetical protein